MSTDKPTPEAHEQAVEQLTQGIEQTRAEMGATLTALEHRLSPSELGEKAKVELDHLETRVKAAVKEGLEEAKDVLHVQIDAAKSAVHDEILAARGALNEQLHEAKSMVTQGLSDARQTVKQDIQTAIATTRQAVRDATIGRVENAATFAGDAMNSARDTLMDTVRQNPIPAALAGIGIAWLLMNRSASSRPRSSQFDGRGPRGGFDGTGGYDGDGSLVDGAGRALHRAQHSVGNAAGQVAHRAGDAVHHVGDALGSAGAAVTGAAHDASDAVRSAMGQGFDAASHLAHDAGAAAGRLAHGASEKTGQFVHNAADAASHLSQQAQHAAGSVAHGARDQAMRLERGLEATMQANPLALGAVVLAVGAAVGFALPHTQREDALMGEARDRLLHGAADLAHDATQSLQHLTDDAGEAAKKALTSAAT